MLTTNTKMYLTCSMTTHMAALIVQLGLNVISGAITRDKQRVSLAWLNIYELAGIGIRLLFGHNTTTVLAEYMKTESIHHLVKQYDRETDSEQAHLSLLATLQMMIEPCPNNNTNACSTTCLLYKTCDLRPAQIFKRRYLRPSCAFSVNQSCPIDCKQAKLTTCLHDHNDDTQLPETPLTHFPE